MIHRILTVLLPKQSPSRRHLPQLSLNPFSCVLLPAILVAATRWWWCTEKDWWVTPEPPLRKTVSSVIERRHAPDPAVTFTGLGPGTCRRIGKNVTSSIVCNSPSLRTVNTGMNINIVDIHTT